MERTNRVTRSYMREAFTRINIVQEATQPANFDSQVLFFNKRGLLNFIFKRRDLQRLDLQQLKTGDD